MRLQELDGVHEAADELAGHLLGQLLQFARFFSSARASIASVQSRPQATLVGPTRHAESSTSMPPPEPRSSTASSVPENTGYSYRIPRRLNPLPTLP